MRQQKLIVFDLGNSDTRLVGTVGASGSGTGSMAAKLYLRDNRFVEVSLQDEIHLEDDQIFHINDFTSANADVVSVLKKQYDLSNVSFVTGSSLVHYENRVLTPDYQDKAFQGVSYLNILSGIVENMSDNGVTSGIDYTVGIALPLNEGGNVPLLSDNLIGKHSIKKNDTTYEFNIVRVMAAGEAYLAFIGLRFDLKGKARSLNTDLKKGKGVLIDVGGGTTDLALFIDGVYLKQKRDNFKIAGRKVYTVLQKLFKNQHNKEMSLKVAEEAVRGERKEFVGIPLAPFVVAAKKEVATEIYRKINEFFLRESILMAELDWVAFVGGTLYDAYDVDGEPTSIIADMLTDYFKTNSPTAAKIIAEEPRLIVIAGAWNHFLSEYNKK